VLDFDTSEDPTHGQQEFAFFNAHYDSYCFLPLFAFARVPGESEEHLVSAELPDTHQRDTDAILATLSRLVQGVRQRWPGMKVVFRADAGFAVPEIYDWCEEHRVGYAIGLPSNAVLQELSREWRERAQRAAATSPTKSARLFGSFWYQAKGWKRLRRVVVKAEETPLGPNPRFVLVDDLPGTPRQQYQYYARRGDSENRIKEMKQAIKSDRTSCCEFASNKVRLMLHSVAYVLYQQLRRVATGSGQDRRPGEGKRQKGARGARERLSDAGVVPETVRTPRHRQRVRRAEGHPSGRENRGRRRRRGGLLRYEALFAGLAAPGKRGALSPGPREPSGTWSRGQRRA
jgi:hypothetical protein